MRAISRFNACNFYLKRPPVRFFNLTLQRYESFIAVHEYFARKNLFFLCFSFPALAVALVAVLQFSKGYSHTLKILLYLYINIELIFDFHTTYFGTATLQQLQQLAQDNELLL